MSARAKRTRPEQVTEAYRRYRVDDQVRYFGSQAQTYERALRRTTRLSAVLLVLAAFCGVLGAVDVTRRGWWAFVAATLAAVSTAVAGYEVAFGFERLSRQYNETLSALKLADAARPNEPDEQGVEQQVVLIEQLLRRDVDSWSHMAFRDGGPPAPD